MTIDEAIKQLNKVSDVWSRDVDDTEKNEALQLGIEALKRERQYRNEGRSGAGFLLPSATEE
jgi:hypothetical protein